MNRPELRGSIDVLKTQDRQYPMQAICRVVSRDSWLNRLLGREPVTVEVVYMLSRTWYGIGPTSCGWFRVPDFTELSSIDPLALEIERVWRQSEYTDQGAP